LVATAISTTSLVRATSAGLAVGAGSTPGSPWVTPGWMSYTAGNRPWRARLTATPPLTVQLMVLAHDEQP